MGIFGALTTAVTGMRAQAFALENISGNIANSQTIAFKREETSFIDLIPDRNPNQQVAGQVAVYSRSTNTVQGDIQNASIDTYMAINGQGYFVVEKPEGFTGNTPNFGGGDLYSRRGDFNTDRNGFLVNGAGYYLKGIPIDPTTGNLTGSAPEILQFSNSFLPAQPTTTLQYQANLPAGSALLDPAATAYTGGTPSDLSVGGTGVVGEDVAQFLDDSISGGAIAVYDATGAAVNMQLRWAKTASGPDTWNLFYQTNSNPAATDPAWLNVGAYDFVNSQMTPAVLSTTVAGVTIDGVSIGAIDIEYGAGGLTQFADSDVRVNTISQDGFSAGSLQSVSVNDKGRVEGTYSNGRTIELAEVTLANFNGPNNLKRLDGGAFAETSDSGPPNFSAAGKIVGSSLEGSNSDIGDEFTKLIVTQQAYSANTKVITTSNQMVQDLLNTLR
jgi:flagellar hook protein FlgE